MRSERPWSMAVLRLFAVCACGFAGALACAGAGEGAAARGAVVSTEPPPGASSRPAMDPPEPSASAEPAVPPVAGRSCVDPPDDEPRRRDDADSHSVPAAPLKIGAVTCRAGEGVWLDAEKRLVACTVDRAVTVLGVPIAAGAYTLFHPSGRPWQTTIPRPEKLRTAAGAEIPCAGGALVVISEEGMLEGCTLAKPLSMGGVACKSGESVAFHAGGQLQAAVMDSPYSALGVTFPAGTRLSFHPSGAVAGAWLREAMSIAGYPVQWDLTVFESGRLRQLTLASALTVSGHAFPADAKLWLREDGSLYRAEYVSQSGFMVHGEPWTDTRHLRFDCRGKIVSDEVTHYQADRPPPGLP